MLNHTLDGLAEPGEMIADPRRLAELFSLTLSDLARVLGISRSTLNDPHSPAYEAAIKPLLKILTIAIDMTGDERRALLWMKYDAIPGLGYKTPLDLIEEGKSDWVVGHMENVRNGVYA